MKAIVFAFSVLVAFSSFAASTGEGLPTVQGLSSGPKSGKASETPFNRSELDVLVNFATSLGEQAAKVWYRPAIDARLFTPEQVNEHKFSNCISTAVDQYAACVSATHSPFELGYCGKKWILEESSTDKCCRDRTKGCSGEVFPWTNLRVMQSPKNYTPAERIAISSLRAQQKAKDDALNEGLYRERKAAEAAATQAANPCQSHDQNWLNNQKRVKQEFLRDFDEGNSGAAPNPARITALPQNEYARCSKYMSQRNDSGTGAEAQLYDRRIKEYYEYIARPDECRRADSTYAKKHKGYEFSAKDEALLRRMNDPTNLETAEYQDANNTCKRPNSPRPPQKAVNPADLTS